jgi:hypothetical protein
MDLMSLKEQVDREFATAGRRARMRNLERLLFGKAGTPARSYSLKKRCGGWSGPAARGRGGRTVETSRILGSVGKNEWFDEDFAPLGDASRERWKRINRGIPARARVASREPLPVGGRVYFVRDGHHRVSVARFHGVEGWTQWSRSSGRRRAR